MYSYYIQPICEDGTNRLKYWAQRRISNVDFVMMIVALKWRAQNQQAVIFNIHSCRSVCSAIRPVCCCFCILDAPSVWLLVSASNLTTSRSQLPPYRRSARQPASLCNRSAAAEATRRRCHCII